MLVDAQERKCYTTGNLHGMLSKHSSTYPARPRVPPKRSEKNAPDDLKSKKQTTFDGVSSKVGKDTTSKKEAGKDTVVKREADGHNVKTENNGQAMEGVRVKLEDKLASMRTKKTDEDVEMTDAASIQSGISTPTTKSDAEKSSNTLANASYGAAASKPRAHLTSTTNAPQIIRKRKPADPFMPQPNRKPRKG